MKKILLSLLLFTAIPGNANAWENDPYTHLPDDDDLPDIYKIPDGAHFKHYAPAHVMYGGGYGQGYRWRHPSRSQGPFRDRFGTWRYEYSPSGRTNYSRPYRHDYYDEFHRWKHNSRRSNWNPGFRHNDWERPY